MERHEKIYLPKISLSAEWENFGKSAKDLFFNLLPLAKPIFLFGFTGFSLLILQVFTVGIFDRFGFSPKISLLVSSLFYIVGFAGLAIVGGLRNKNISLVFEANLKTRPLCKMLIIKRKI